MPRRVKLARDSSLGICEMRSGLLYFVNVLFQSIGYLCRVLLLLLTLIVVFLVVILDIIVILDIVG